MREKLSYETLRNIGYRGYILEHGSEKVLQFGEGNFLRAFADCFLDCVNEKTGWNGKAVVVQPRGSGLSEIINGQNGLYTLYLKGMEEGKPVEHRRIISSVSRCLNPEKEFDRVLEAAAGEELKLIITNTTEAGIAYDQTARFEDHPPAAFPAKLTRILYHRYCAGKSGLIILSCELIDNNGAQLKNCVLAHGRDWKLEPGFFDWLNNDNFFCSTLVDRIVSGRPGKEEEAELQAVNGYRDELMDVGECYGFWAIEGDESVSEKLPFTKCDLPVKVVSDITPYKLRKVRILNGGHTGMALGAYLAGKNLVRECMGDEVLRRFLHKMLMDEIIPVIPMDRDELKEFALAAEERFENPYIDHELLSISLNSTAKWRTRNLPSLLDYFEKYHRLPPCLTLSLAAYIAFCTSDVQGLGANGLVCRRNREESYLVKDEEWILRFFLAHSGDSAKKLTYAVLSSSRLWGMDLTGTEGLPEAVSEYLQCIRRDGMRTAFQKCIQAEERV